MEPNTPELERLYRCTRFPRHEVYDMARIDSHTCGEHQPIEHETLVRYVLTHGH
jgi:hypothetical protein